MVDYRLKDKVVLITGGNHGIGAATARAFAAEGVAVLINYLRMPPLGPIGRGIIEADELTTHGIAHYNAIRARPADETVQAIRAQGGRVEAVEADLADPATISMLFDRAETLFGPVECQDGNFGIAKADHFLQVVTFFQWSFKRGWMWPPLPKTAMPRKRTHQGARAKRQTGNGTLSTMDMAPS